MSGEIIVHPSSAVIISTGVEKLLDNIRPHWKEKRLIERVMKLLRSDPSSACQRLLNAAIQDLREKVVIAGIDIAKEAASSNKLSPINKPEDVENYSPQNIIDISHYIGLLSRPDWRRLIRCYEIRRDLEHEDDEYEAGVEDCVYIFKTTVDVVLSRDPIKVISVTDIIAQIESPQPIMLSADYLSDYEHAHKQRQIEIVKMLVSKFLSSKSPEILRSNAFNCLKSLRDITKNTAKVELGSYYQQQNERAPLTNEQVWVMNVSGLLPYFTSAAKAEYFEGLLNQFETVGYHWKKWESHSELLQLLTFAGGLENIPPEICDRFILWLFKCYIGEPGGYGAGASRRVFFSDTGAPICKSLISQNKTIVKSRFSQNQDLEVEFLRIAENTDLQRRYESLVDILESVTLPPRTPPLTMRGSAAQIGQGSRHEEGTVHRGEDRFDPS